MNDDIVIGDKISLCGGCHKQHVCKRCSKNMHICMFCGKITHECDICGMVMDCISAIKRHQAESKFCKKARCKTTLTMEEYLVRFNIIVKGKANNRELRRKSIC